MNLEAQMERRGLSLKNSIARLENKLQGGHPVLERGIIASIVESAACQPEVDDMFSTITWSGEKLRGNQKDPFLSVKSIDLRTLTEDFNHIPTWQELADSVTKHAQTPVVFDRNKPAEKIWKDPPPNAAYHFKISVN